MGRHVLNVVVVSNERVRIDPVLVGFAEASGEHARVFIVEQEEYPEKAAFFLGVFPVALKALTFRKIFENLDFAPIAKTIFIPPEALSAGSRAVRVSL